MSIAKKGWRMHAIDLTNNPKRFRMGAQKMYMSTTIGGPLLALLEGTQENHNDQYQEGKRAQDSM